MPRKPEPSFGLKLIIWDIAATTGTENFSAIYREVDQRLEELRREGKLFEDTPDQRKVHDIIELDIQRLTREVVVAKLPPHVWRLRHDYEEIKQLAKGSIEAKREAPREDDLAKISGVGKEKAKPGEMAGVASPPESKRPLQVLVGRDVLELASAFKNDLSEIDALDGAVYQLHGDPWTSDIPSVLHVSHYPELKVVLAIEHEQPGQFLLLTEQVEAISPGFRVNFREWERRSLTPFVGGCQEIIREIWYKAREGTGLEMSHDRGYGLLLNVPLFVYRFALKRCAESSPAQPDLELNPADVDRFPYLPPHYRQLTGRGEPDLLLAAGSGPVVNHSRGITTDVMDLCKLVTTELCQLYAQDDKIREIVREQEALQKEREPFLKALSDFLRSFTGG